MQFYNNKLLESVRCCQAFNDLINLSREELSLRHKPYYLIMVTQEYRV
jgi:hypothetical protein